MTIKYWHVTIENENLKIEEYDTPPTKQQLKAQAEYKRLIFAHNSTIPLMPYDAAPLISFDEYKAFVNRCFAKDASLKFMKSHCLVGIATEFFEYLEAETADDPVNIEEELGDMFFYIVQLANLWGLEIEPSLEASTHGIGIIEDIGHALDRFKKQLYYEKEIDENDALADLCLGWRQLCTKNCHHTLDRIINSNYKKLSVRYPNGFTKEDAIARADKPEES